MFRVTNVLIPFYILSFKKILNYLIFLCACLIFWLNLIKYFSTVSGSMDSSLMVWHFKPHMRAYRFVGHKVISVGIIWDFLSRIAWFLTWLNLYFLIISRMQSCLLNSHRQAIWLHQRQGIKLSDYGCLVCKFDFEMIYFIQDALCMYLYVIIYDWV